MTLKYLGQSGLDNFIKTLKLYFATKSDLNSLIEKAELAALEKDNPVGKIITWSPVTGSTVDLSTAAKVAAYFGFGTWTQIKDVFPLAAGDTYAANETGGNATHTHTFSPNLGNVDYATGNGLNYTLGGSVAKNAITTSAASSIPPYKAFYMWQRTA